LGRTIPDTAAERSALLESEFRRIDELLAGRSIASLAQLPRMQDLGAKRVATLIVAMWPSAFLVNAEHLTSLLSARLVRLSLEHGNTEESAIGYITHAITVNARTGDYRQGNEFGLVGLAVNDRFGDVRLLRRRREDIPLLASFWLGRDAKRLGTPLEGFRRDAEQLRAPAPE
jgi:predicted ATPase